jgi:DNA-directed RNA polymerase specialized sigma subunit
MNVPTNHQIIIKDGEPIYVLVPYDEYVAVWEKENQTIPHEVVEYHILDGQSMVRAWRTYKGLSQQEVAERMSISQSAYSQMERPTANLRPDTLTKIAAALGISPEQLDV